uniref:Basic proline-rich protein n=1 Tax=Parastrongyloides trichosuri TaxID=131310 RepID=A0A0N4ZCV3_PARTI
MRRTGTASSTASARAWSTSTARPRGLPATCPSAASAPPATTAPAPTTPPTTAPTPSPASRPGPSRTSKARSRACGDDPRHRSQRRRPDRADPFLCGPVAGQPRLQPEQGRGVEPACGGLAGPRQDEDPGRSGPAPVRPAAARAAQHPLPAVAGLLGQRQDGAGQGLARRPGVCRRRLFGLAHVGRQRRDGDAQRRRRRRSGPLHPRQPAHQPAPLAGASTDQARPGRPIPRYGQVRRP